MGRRDNVAGLVLAAVVAGGAAWLLFGDHGGEPGFARTASRSEGAAATHDAEGVRLAGRPGPSQDRPADGVADDAERVERVEGTVVAVTDSGTTPVADVPAVIALEAFRHKMGIGSYWIIHRETVTTGADGGYALPVPKLDHYLSAAYVTIEPPEGWLEPPRVKLDDGRVFVAVEIPTRIYDNRKWVSLPAPDGSAWPLDASGRWARPVIQLERAAGVEGLALDPWGRRLPHVIVGCSWPVRTVGLHRRIALTDAMGRFAFEVPATTPQVELDLRLRPRWKELWRLEPPAPPRNTPSAPVPPSEGESSPKPSPNRHPWPGIPCVVVQPGARGVVLQAREDALVSGWVTTTDGHVVTEGSFDVQPGPNCPWPVGYDYDSERRIKTTFEPDGRFVVRGLPAGQWVLVFRQVRKDAPPLLGHVFTEAPSDEVRLVCRPAVKLELEFVVALGEPPLDRESWIPTLFLQPASETAGPGWWSDVDAPLLTRFRDEEDATRRSGQRGTRADVWLDDTPGVLYAVDDDGRQALLEDVDPGGGVYRVVLRSGGVIAGLVADFDRLGHLENGVRNHTPDVWVVARRGHINREGTMDRNGRFRIDGLPAGTWNVALQGEHIYGKNPRTRRTGVSTGTTDVVLHAR